MNRNNGSRIFLTELMFSILFFIIIAAVCVQCFAQSFVMSRQANELTQAVNVATNAAEIFTATNKSNNFTKYFDENWVEVDDAGEYMVTGIVTEMTTMDSMNIRVVSLSDDSEIYTLNVEKAKYLED